MDWFGKGSKVEGRNELESLGIRFEPILFNSDRDEYEFRIQLPGCPKNLIKLTYNKPSGELKLQGTKQKIEFVHQFTAPPDCSATKIYGRFRGDVLHIIMPRLLSSKQEYDQRASAAREPTEQVGEDRDKLPATVLSLPPPPSDEKTTEMLSQRDNALFPEISSAPQPSVKELRENYQKNISKIAAPPPPPPPPPHAAATAPWNLKTTKNGWRKEVEEHREPPSNQGDVEPEKSDVKSQKKESKLGQEVTKSVKIAMAEQGDIESEKLAVISQDEESKSGQEVAKNEQKTEEKREEKQPSAGGNKTLGLVAKVKKTSKAAVAAAMKEENRPVVMIGATVLTLVVIGASLGFSSKKTKN